MNHTMKENTVNPLEGVEFRPIEKKMIEAWTYFIRNNPTAKYKIGDMKEYQENNYMISCDLLWGVCALDRVSVSKLCIFFRT